MMCILLFIITIPAFAGESVLNVFRSNVPTMTFGIASHHTTVSGAVSLWLSYGANNDATNARNAKYAPIRKFLSSANSPIDKRAISVQKNAVVII